MHAGFLKIIEGTSQISSWKRDLTRRAWECTFQLVIINGHFVRWVKYNRQYESIQGNSWGSSKPIIGRNTYFVPFFCIYWDYCNCYPALGWRVGILGDLSGDWGAISGWIWRSIECLVFFNALDLLFQACSSYPSVHVPPNKLVLGFGGSLPRGFRVTSSRLHTTNLSNDFFKCTRYSACVCPFFSQTGQGSRQ